MHELETIIKHLEMRSFKFSPNKVVLMAQELKKRIYWICRRF